MENQETSSTVLRHPQNQLKWLEIAEYSAFGAAVFGSGLTLLFEQILFVTTPIILALFLNIINRKIFAEIPPRVEYSLTKKGQTLLPVFDKLNEWGSMHLND